MLSMERKRYFCHLTCEDYLGEDEGYRVCFNRKCKYEVDFYEIDKVVYCRSKKSQYVQRDGKIGYGYPKEIYFTLRGKKFCAKISIKEDSIKMMVQGGEYTITNAWLNDNEWYILQCLDAEIQHFLYSDEDEILCEFREKLFVS